jgi:hypothetical protein
VVIRMANTTTSVYKAVDTLRNLTRRLETHLKLSRHLAWQNPAHRTSNLNSKSHALLDIGLLNLMQTCSPKRRSNLSLQ